MQVVTAVTGDTIEIVHTDAEGRLLLADTLALASRQADAPLINGFSAQSPALMIDFATLTGMLMYTYVMYTLIHIIIFVCACI